MIFLYDIRIHGKFMRIMNAPGWPDYGYLLVSPWAT
jgi:hypothetical protein